MPPGSPRPAPLPAAPPRCQRTARQGPQFGSAKIESATNAGLKRSDKPCPRDFAVPSQSRHIGLSQQIRPLPWGEATELMAVGGGDDHIVGGVKGCLRAAFLLATARVRKWDSPVINLSVRSVPTAISFSAKSFRRRGCPPAAGGGGDANGHRRAARSESFAPPSFLMLFAAPPGEAARCTKNAAPGRRSGATSAA